ncbi:hypothetical protein C8R44DRAFT_987591 [Mycena epipterygia]|nr:hypothetical protein C8R44DRAFT_987591 [Mycena epipterygia]
MTAMPRDVSQDPWPTFPPGSARPAGSSFSLPPAESVSRFPDMRADNISRNEITT